MINLLSSQVHAAQTDSAHRSQELNKGEEVRVLDLFFPGAILAIFDNNTGDIPRFMSRNAAKFWGMSEEEFAKKTYHDMRAMLHPDDLEGFLRCRQRIYELANTLKPKQDIQYKFVIQYRFRTQNQAYRHISCETITYLDENGRAIQAILYRDVSAERVSDRVQLDWYRIEGVSCCKVGSYVPAVRNQALTVREKEVIQLIKEGFNSKEIADRLSISLHTVKNHRKSLMRKTQSRNIADLLYTVSEGIC